ncbi:MAG: NAD(P)H-dependent oxidoreductase subunit E [Candidatus Solibacter sp.]|nr:NAD(P)H-dependent oxidoreductase subunit E [Candidatus Solibacter sp.]
MRTAARISGGLIALCVVVLLTDYAIATRRGPKDDQLIKALQEQVKSDAGLAPKLAGEQKRVTAARRARKSRDNAIAWLLIVASAVFLTAAKQVVGQPLRTRKGYPGGGSDRNRESSRPSRDMAPSGPGALPIAPPIDLAFVDQLVVREGRGKESAIILLQAIQSHYRYLPDEALRRLCELTEITPAEVAGTSSFYGQFRRSPVGKHVVRVCHGTACHVAGARQITEELRRHLNIPEGADTDAERLFTVDEVACLGCCSLAPVLTVDGHTSGRLTPTTACHALAPFAEKEPA